MVKPTPALFCAVGGNHEAANHLWELYYGGWVAKKIFYMGHAGVINFGGVRIGGLSGIYNGKHYRLVSKPTKEREGHEATIPVQQAIIAGVTVLEDFGCDHAGPA